MRVLVIRPERSEGQLPREGEMGKAEGAAAVPKGYTYKPQYGVIVLCKDEAEHRRVYDKLKARGYKCRVVCT